MRLGVMRLGVTECGVRGVVTPMLGAETKHRSSAVVWEAECCGTGCCGVERSGELAVRCRLETGRGCGAKFPMTAVDAFTCVEHVAGNTEASDEAITLGSMRFWYS